MNFLQEIFGDTDIYESLVIEHDGSLRNVDLSDLAQYLHSVFTEDRVFYNTEEVFGLNVYFYLNEDNQIVFSDSMHSLLSQKISENGRIVINNQLKAVYLDVGFILPPFTIYNEIFVLPQYSSILKDKNMRLAIELNFPIHQDAEAFKDISDFSSTIENSIQQILAKNTDDSNYVCTLSGGADSALLLFYLNNHRPKNIYSYTCIMPSALSEEQKAEKISNVLDIENIKFNFDEKSASKHIDQFLKKYLVPIYDPIVPVYSAMFSSLDQDLRFKGRKNIIIEGQSADTIFFGLPHNVLLNLYKSWLFCSIFKTLSWFLPKYPSKDSFVARFFYRVHKLAESLAEQTWQDAFLKSLDHEKNTYPYYYQFLSNFLTHIHSLSNNRHDAILVFFLYINQVREFQKYKLIPENYKLITPFLNAGIISRSFKTPKDFFTKGFKKKIPIFKIIRSTYGNIIRDNQTLPFYINYKFEYKKQKRDDQNSEDNYLNIKRYSIISIEKYLNKLSNKNKSI